MQGLTDPSTPAQGGDQPAVSRNNTGSRGAALHRVTRPGSHVKANRTAVGLARTGPAAGRNHIILFRSRRARNWRRRAEGFAACAYLVLLWVLLS